MPIAGPGAARLPLSLSLLPRDPEQEKLFPCFRCSHNTQATGFRLWHELRGEVTSAHYVHLLIHTPHVSLSQSSGYLKPQNK